MKRPPELYLLLFLHLLLSLNALTGGALLVLAPDGSLLGMAPGWLSRTPFPDYFLPGITLFTLLGLFPLFTLVGLLTKPHWRWGEVLNLYPGRHWSWACSLYSGLMLLIWITVQISLTPAFWLQPVLNGVGVLMVVCTLLPRVMRHYGQASAERQVKQQQSAEAGTPAALMPKL